MDHRNPFKADRGSFVELNVDKTDLYHVLDNKFQVDVTREKDWIALMDSYLPYLSEHYQRRKNGIMFDFADTITQIFTATFLSNQVVNELRMRKATNSLVISHHPLDWKVTGVGEKRTPQFHELNQGNLQFLKDHKIGVYVLHVPMDKNGPLSTSMTLARTMDGKWEQELDFFDYFGIKVGVVARLEDDTVSGLCDTIEQVVSHPVAQYNYGDNKIHQRLVGFVGGGGFKERALQDLLDRGVNTFVTGITMKTAYNMAAHKFAKNNKINTIGATHYSTERFAPLAIGRWLSDEFGFDTSFIKEDPDFGDIDLPSS